jgi:hypothetical protein
VRCIVLVLLVLAGACSSGTGPIQHRPSGGSTTAPARDAGPIATPALTDRDCEALVAHAIDVRIAELRATTPPERLPTDAETSALRAELLRTDPGCKTLAPASYRCAMAARTSADIAACHSTPSNSTSNRSVAPGGMTPPAPAFP